MKRVIILILLSCFSCWLFSQTLEEREKKIIARNNIKTKTQWDYNYQNGKPSKQGKKSSITTYSPSGLVLEKNNLNNKELVTGWEKFQYDTKGNRTLYERNSGSGAYKKTSQYDTKNNLTLETGFNGSDNFKNTLSYNNQGKLSEVVYSTNNNIDEKRVYVYYENTSIIGIYTKDNSLISKIKLVFDNNSNIIEEIVLSFDDRELEKKKYKYDNASRIIEEEKTRGGSFYYRLTYTFNSSGELLTISEENLSEKKYVKKSFRYDEGGDLLEFKWRRSSADDFNIKTYTYNSLGICQTEHTFYPSTKYELLTKYEYEFY
jgi:YD repeat-containing protein